MDSSQSLILVIDDERPLRRLLDVALAGQGYHFAEASNAQEGLQKAALLAPHLILLDLGLPDEDGLQTTGRLREWYQNPILVLSARGQESDKIRALDAGADDYITKPFAMGELLARIRVALRRHRDEKLPESSRYAFGSVTVDFQKRLVRHQGQAVHLTPIEYKILRYLIQQAGKVVTHKQILKEVWGPFCTQQNHYVRVYMTQLRHKLETDPARPEWLLTETGIGYRLKTEL